MSTLSELRSQVREAVFERASDTGLIPDDVTLTRWIDLANKSIWSVGVKRNPAAWTARTGAISVPVDGVPFATINAGGVHQVKAVWRQGSDGVFRYLLPLEEVNEHLPADEAQSGGPDSSFRWYIEGGTVRLTPVPTVAQTCKFKIVATPATLTTPAGDSVQALGGQYPEHHGLVALRAAQLLYRKDEEKETPWDEAVRELSRLFLDAVSRSQGHYTRRIIRRRAYP